MFYCDECAKKRGWPNDALLKSFGACELCKKERVCNNIKSKDLPFETREGRMTARELSNRARNELNKDGQRGWLFFVYGYMTSKMTDLTLIAFEEELEQLKKTHSKNK